MKNVLDIKYHFPDLAKKVKKNRRRIEEFMAATMQTNRALLFNHEGAYSGHKKWKPLKFRNGKPLMARGTLKKSIGPQNDGKRPRRGPNSIVEFQNGIVRVGTSLKYAGIHNRGGVVQARHAQALKIPMPSGAKATDEAKEHGKVMFRKSVKIPKRNFSDITPEDKREFTEALVAVVSEVLSE